MNVSLAWALDDGVVAVGHFMGLAPHVIEQGRADARLVAKTHHHLRAQQVWVSLSWRKKFPKRKTYGEALNAAVATAEASWAVTNRLNGATRKICEAGVTPRPTVSQDGMFTFLLVALRDTIPHSIEQALTSIPEPAEPATAFDYLCFAAAEPNSFVNKHFVAAGDTVPMGHSEECHAPTLFFQDARLRLYSRHKKAVPNGTVLHYMAVQPLIV